MRFFLGSYTSDGGGSSSGIAVLHAGNPESALASGQLTAASDAALVQGSPSWLAWHPYLEVLYAALEGAGSVQAFRRIGAETLVAVGDPVAVGQAVCHIAVEPGGLWLVASCWGDGRVVQVSLDAVGVPRAAKAAPTAEIATYAAPDAQSRAHQARFVGSTALVTTDLGLDQVRVWSTEGAVLREVDRVALPLGCGPRHTVWHPSGHLYVVTEASLELFVIAPPTDGRGWRLVGGTPLSSGASLGSDAAAEIALSRDARTVYTALRGSDTMAVLRVHDGGLGVKPLALTESGVAWPRHHTVAADTLLVAGERSHEVVSLDLDDRTGLPGDVRHRISTPSPAQLLPDHRKAS